MADHLPFKPTSFADLPVDTDLTWKPNGETSADLITALLGPDGDDWGAVKDAHLAFAPGEDHGGDPPTIRGAYKLPIARRDPPTDPEGRIVVVLRQAGAAVAAIRGARGGVDIPEDVKGKAMRLAKRYYDKADEEFPGEVDDFSRHDRMLADQEAIKEAIREIMAERDQEDGRLEIQDRTLLAVGEWNETVYEQKDIKPWAEILRTDPWTDTGRYRLSVFPDHVDMWGGGVEEWLGVVVQDSIRWDNKKKALVGTILLHDKDLIGKLRAQEEDIGRFIFQISPLMSVASDEVNDALKGRGEETSRILEWGSVAIVIEGAQGETAQLSRRKHVYRVPAPIQARRQEPSTKRTMARARRNRREKRMSIAANTSVADLVREAAPDLFDGLSDEDKDQLRDVIPEIEREPVDITPPSSPTGPTRSFDLAELGAKDIAKLAKQIVAAAGGIEPDEVSRDELLERISAVEAVLASAPQKPLVEVLKEAQDSDPEKIALRKSLEDRDKEIIGLTLNGLEAEGRLTQKTKGAAESILALAGRADSNVARLVALGGVSEEPPNLRDKLVGFLKSLPVVREDPPKGRKSTSAALQIHPPDEVEDEEEKEALAKEIADKRARMSGKPQTAAS